MAFGPIVRWLNDEIIPRDRSFPDFLQRSACAYADDLAVAAPSFWTLTTVIAPAFDTVVMVTDMNLNHKKCWWVQKGNVACETLSEWTANNCPDFREMNFAKCAQHIGARIGPEGYLHRRTAPRNQFPQNMQEPCRHSEEPR